MLEDSQLVRAAPPLDHFAVPKSRDLNPACANLPSRRSYAQKFALLRAGHRVRNGYLVLVGYHRSTETAKSGNDVRRAANMRM